MQKYQTKKRFGQHFLHDRYVINSIVTAIHPQNGECLVEIGPGLGALTFPLLEKIDNLHVVEIDTDIIERLRDRQEPRLSIHAVDALKFDPGSIDRDDKLLRVVGNLPYNISTPLIFHLLESATLIQDMHFMLQKEVVDRMTAHPNSKTYGRLSVMVQYHCQTESLFKVPPGAFRPPPKVDSAVIRLIPRVRKAETAKNEKTLSQVVNQAFMKRRKTLRNALRDVLSEEQIKQAGVDPQLRPENLQVADYVRLSDQL